MTGCKALALVLAAALAPSFALEAQPVCGGMAWAVMLSDGYAIGRIREVSGPQRQSDYAKLIVTGERGEGTELLVERPDELRGLDDEATQVFFFVTVYVGTSSRRFLVQRPRLAVLPLSRLGGEDCLNASALERVLARRFQRGACDQARRLVADLQTYRFQDAINEVSDLPKTKESASCLADATENGAKPFKSDYVDPFSGERYYAPISTVGQLIEILIPGLFGVPSPSNGNSPGYSPSRRRLFWRSYLEAWPKDFRE